MLAKKFGAKYIGVTGSPGDLEFEKKVPKGVRVGFGIQGLLESCSVGDPDIVLIAVVGIAGLPPLIECLDRGVNVALANKESLVCGGHIVKQKMKTSKSEVFPVDSELCAIYQCLAGMDTTKVCAASSTASGGLPSTGKKRSRKRRWNRRCATPTGAWAKDHCGLRYLHEQGLRSLRRAGCLTCRPRRFPWWCTGRASSIP